MPKDQYEIWLKALARKRAPAEAQAAELLTQRRFDEAEQAVRRVDDSIYGAVALAKLYESHLQALVAAGEVERDRAHLEEVFRRALNMAQSCYPEPHTACEADNYERGRVEDRARLVGILGYDPPSWPSPSASSR